MKTGILLVNIGTPNSPQKKDVKRYLKEFLWDPRVVDLPFFARFLLLHLFILPFRPKKSSAAYQSIWSSAGSPLDFYSKNLTKQVSLLLGKNFEVRYGMRYQSPSLEGALNALFQKNVDRIVVFPLFPQYSSAATGSALQKVGNIVNKRWNVLPITTISPFYAHPKFVDCFSHLIQEQTAPFKPDFILFSYHGLPERHIRKSDIFASPHCFQNETCCEQVNEKNKHCYRAQCHLTTKLISQKLQLTPQKFCTSFQSRLGRTKWIEPYTDKVLPQLASRGFQKIAVVCPSFVADCLETLEEIGIRAKEQWRALGGEDLLLVTSLNVHEKWVKAVADMVGAAVDFPKAKERSA